jgi:hypothetical protein
MTDFKSLGLCHKLAAASESSWWARWASCEIPSHVRIIRGFRAAWIKWWQPTTRLLVVIWVWQCSCHCWSRLENIFMILWIGRRLGPQASQQLLPLWVIIRLCLLVLYLGYDPGIRVCMISMSLHHGFLCPNLALMNQWWSQHDANWKFLYTYIHAYMHTYIHTYIIQVLISKVSLRPEPVTVSW